MARFLRTFAATVATSVTLVIGLAILVLAVELSIPLGALRTPLSLVAAKALGVDAAIHGPIRLITGPKAGLEILGARFSDGPSGNGWSAEIGRLRVRIAAVELLSREIHIEEADLEEARLCASFPSQPPDRSLREPPPPVEDWRLTRVERLTAVRVTLGFGSSCAVSLPAFEISALHGSAPADGAPVIAANGRFRGERWQAEVRPPSLTLLSEGSLPAPFELSGVFAAARFRATGMAMPWPPSVDADVSVESDQFATLLRLFDDAFKDFGPLTARARVQINEDRLAARVHEAQLAPGAISGDIAIDWSHKRPQISLSARAGALDAAIIQEWWLRSRGDMDAADAGHTPLFVALPRETEGKLTFDTERVSAGRVSLDAATISGGWSGGTARISMVGRVDGAPVRGHLNADVRSDELAVSAAMDADSFSLAREGIRGEFGHVSADLEARGRIGQTLLKSIRASVVANDARVGLDDAGARPVVLLRSASAHWEPGERLRAILLGTAWGEQLDARVEGADASRLLRGEPWSMAVTGTLGALKVNAGGEAILDADKPRLSLDVDANAARLGTLAAGHPLLVGKAVHASGKIDIAGRDWKMGFTTLSIGGSRGRASARGAFPLSSRPVIASAAFDVLDLSKVGRAAEPNDSPDQHKLLPRNVRLPDADLRISAERLVLPSHAQASLKLKGRSRQGRLVLAPFALVLDGAHVTGTLAADLRSTKARVSAKLDAEGLDTRHFPAALANSGVGGRIGHATLAAKSKGNRFDELATNARLDLKLSDAQFVAAPRGWRTAPTATVAQASLRIAPKLPTSIDVIGFVDGHSLSLQASTEPLAPLLDAQSAPFAVAGTLAGVELRGRGKLPMSDANHGASLNLDMSAKQMNALNSLLNIELPPVGPVALNAAVRDFGGTEIAGDFKLAVGESRIHATATRHLEDGRPTFDVELTSPLLRLEDLGSQYWMAAREATLRHAGVARMPEPDSHLQGSGWRRGLDAFDARVRVAADRVTSGGEDLGSGEIEATLQSGQLQVVPLRLRAGSASLEAKLNADLGAPLPQYRFQAALDRFPYGRFLKALDPMSQHDGQLGLKLWLTATGELDELLSRLQGEAEVVVLPRGSHAHVLDPLGAGFVRTLLGRVDGAKESRLNCAVAAFEIGEGHARSAKLMLDSTRARAAGELDINFADLALNGWVTPEPKGTSLPTAWLPVRISGTLEQPHLAAKTGVAAGAIKVASAFQLFLSKVFAVEAMPADGSNECLDMYRGLQETDRNESAEHEPRDEEWPQISG